MGVNRMLADKDYRKRVVANISDPSVKSFWVDEFEKYGERYMQEAGAAIQNKIGQFVSNPLVRNIIGQPKSTFDIRKVMDEKKILIVNLSKGRVGEANANLLGSMLITKVYLAAMSRADVNEATLNGLPQFYLYVDEFQNFANESFADILSEARKYKLNLTIAHQYIEQMSEEVRDAVFGNVGTMIVFRVGAFDAEVLEKEFSPTFTAEDLVNLGFVQIYLKLMIDGVTSPPFSANTLPPIEKPAKMYKDEIVENSRKVFARPKVDVEKEIHDWHQPVVVKSEQKNNNNQNNLNSSQKHEDKKTNLLKDIKLRPNERPLMPPQKNPFENIKIEDGGKIVIKEERKDNAISLESLKPKEKKNFVDPKAPSKENVSSLKQALASVVEKSKLESKGVQQESSPQKSVPQSGPKEVPEDVLRKILEV